MAKSFTVSHKRKGGYIRKFEEILASPAYRDLTPVARCLLDEFQRIYRPQRNGQLSISVRRAAKLINIHKDTAGKAFIELAEHGFIKLVNSAEWRKALAREWALTFEPVNNREPTDEWKLWKKNYPIVKLSQKPRYKKLDPKIAYSSIH